MVSPVTLYSLWPVLPVRLATTCPPATPIGRPTRADKSGSRPIWPARSSWPARHRCCAQVERRRPPMAQSPDVLLDAIFDLARRLGLGDHFFAGDVEAAWRHQLDPSGLTLAQLRANLVGVKADLATNYRKYASLDPSTGKPRGFPTPSRLEVYSARFAEAGYDLLPCHNEPPKVRSARRRRRTTTRSY